MLYIQNSYFCTLSKVKENTPLLDTLFPDISRRLQCQHHYTLDTYPSDTGFKKLVLWVGGLNRKPKDEPLKADSISKPTIVTKEESKYDSKTDRDEEESKKIDSQRPWVKTPVRIEPIEGLQKTSSGEDVFRKKNLFK